MAALTASRNTDRKGSISAPMPNEYSYQLGAAKKVFAGGIVVAAATGYAEAGTTAAAKTTLGVAAEDKDNTSGAAGDLSVLVRPGVYVFDNATAGDAVTQAEVGLACYVFDDHTVTKTSTGRSKAGQVLEVSSDGVTVAIGNSALSL